MFESPTRSPYNTSKYQNIAVNYILYISGSKYCAFLKKAVELTVPGRIKNGVRSDYVDPTTWKRGDLVVCGYLSVRLPPYSCTRSSLSLF